MKETEYYSERKKGIIGTIVFHVIVLLLMIFLGFFTPLPLPGEEGILVNFGNSENGLGDREPAPARQKEPTPTPAPPKREEPKATPQPATPPPATTPKSNPKPANEAVMTQDYEKTVAIEAAEKKKKEEERKKQEQLAEDRRKKQAEDAQKKALADAEAKRKADAEAKAKAEAAAIAKAEAERKAKEEAERKRLEEEQRKINEINSRTAGAFTKSGNGTGGTGSGDGKSQGVTFPGGNQGVPTGDPNAGNYGQGGSGSGNQGSGISFSLSGRSAISLPKPQYPGNDAGMVVVKVTVDKTGKVTSAEPGVQGTTIMDQKFWNEAKQAALKARFNVNENAAAFQQGTISYRFVLD
ncbi:cell envelope integrity protein TolA [Maribellus sp. YY47]|uniref:cell envelope integrity protein TolA n=1 Tax=Maribellus sp. YY47 TaxID=2929486 RepID=UPI0020008468|nr:cell envelope integrity protein TolA [Maribellus sp. YY47]MCK3684960.1 cell envelope integrity protein TolA [Maribellus sp. YY47]